MRPTEKPRSRSCPEKKADFVEPMECEPVSKLQEGSQWVYEIKLDGYRAIAVKSDHKVRLFSRRQKSFNQQYPYIVEALVDQPNGTVVDGEIVALDDSARPQFNLLQNYRSEAHRIRYFVFDLLCYGNRDTTSLPLVERRALLRKLKFRRGFSSWIFSKPRQPTWLQPPNNKAWKASSRAKG
jgi:bifunctional non-homologous end joining protein LigD